MGKAGPFRGHRGLSQHMRHKHPSVTTLKLRLKTLGWSDEERYSIAVKQLAPGASESLNTRAGLSRAMHEIHPSRSVDSFKLLLTSESYLAIVDMELRKNTRW